MASHFYWKAIKRVADNTIDLKDDTIKIGLSTSVHVPNKDDQFIDDGGADDFVDGEPNITNYVGPTFGNSGRKTLANKALVDDATNDRFLWDADDVTWSALGSGATIAQATVMKEVTTNGDSPCIANLDFPDTATSGVDFVVSFPATGIGYSTV